jgi:hypothetical protein
MTSLKIEFLAGDDRVRTAKLVGQEIRRSPATTPASRAHRAVAQHFAKVEFSDQHADLALDFREVRRSDCSSEPASIS